MTELTEERIIQLIWSTQITVEGGMTERDAQAMGHALWLFRHKLVAAIQGDVTEPASLDLPPTHKFNKSYYRRQGKKVERERIIKLLQEHEAVGSAVDGDYLDTAKLINVIRGETND